MHYQYFYPVWSGIFLIVWLCLFLLRKDTRYEMLVISTLFGFGGLASEKLFIKDWWRPETLSHTSIGVEDFVIGFAIAGIAAVIYSTLYKKRLLSLPRNTTPIHAEMFLITFAFAFLGLFYIVKVSSFYAAILAYAGGSAYVYVKRTDLMYDSLVSGVVMLILGTSVYFLLQILYPGYIEAFWYLRDNWYSHLLLGIPLGEYIWFFCTGAFIGPLYEFIANKKLVSLKY